VWNPLTLIASRRVWLEERPKRWLQGIWQGFRMGWQGAACGRRKRTLDRRWTRCKVNNLSRLRRVGSVDDRSQCQRLEQHFNDCHCHCLACGSEFQSQSESESVSEFESNWWRILEIESSMLGPCGAWTQPWLPQKRAATGPSRPPVPQNKFSSHLAKRMVPNAIFHIYYLAKWQNTNKKNVFSSLKLVKGVENIFIIDRKYKI